MYLAIDRVVDVEPSVSDSIDNGVDGDALPATPVVAVLSVRGLNSGGGPRAFLIFNMWLLRDGRGEVGQ